MSVAVLITYHDGVASPGPKYLPVATERTFAEQWVTAATALGCVWMPLFQSGVPVPLEDFPTVLAELRQLRDYFTAETDRSATASAGALPGVRGIRERSTWLIEELEKIDLATIKELWIG